MNFIAELRSNSRLRIGLALIVGIIWLSLLLDLREQNNGLIDRYKQTVAQLGRFNTQQKQTQWVMRAQDAKDVLAAVERRLWQNPTLGLTQAEMHDWLMQQLLQAKAAQYTVKVSESGGDKGGKKDSKSDHAPADLIRVRAQIEFTTNPDALDRLLAALAESEHQIVVESLSAKQPRTELTVTSWYKVQPVAPASNVQPSVAVH